jgi:hypothetical protein
MTALVLFKKLTERITGSQLDCSSALLTAMSNIVITSGDAVRGIESAVIKTSMSQFFDFCRAEFVAGLGN